MTERKPFYGSKELEPVRQVFDLVPGIELGDFFEDILYSCLMDEGLIHITDPNWIEDGKFTQGILEPRLHQGFDSYLRMDRYGKVVLRDNQFLANSCYFSTVRDGIYISEASALMIDVLGNGEEDGQYVALSLDNPSAMLQVRVI